MVTIHVNGYALPVHCERNVESTMKFQVLLLTVGSVHRSTVFTSVSVPTVASLDGISLIFFFVQWQFHW